LLVNSIQKNPQSAAAVYWRKWGQHQCQFSKLLAGKLSQSSTQITFVIQLLLGIAVAYLSQGAYDRQTLSTFFALVLMTMARK